MGRRTTFNPEQDSLLRRFRAFLSERRGYEMHVPEFLKEIDGGISEDHFGRLERGKVKSPALRAELVTKIERRYGTEWREFLDAEAKAGRTTDLDDSVRLPKVAPVWVPVWAGAARTIAIAAAALGLSAVVLLTVASVVGAGYLRLPARDSDSPPADVAAIEQMRSTCAYEAERTHLHPWDYVGRVWIRIEPDPEMRRQLHHAIVSWGPWSRTLWVQFADKREVYLVHRKVRRDAWPINVGVSPAACLILGVDNPPAGHVVDLDAEPWFPLDWLGRLRHLT